MSRKLRILKEMGCHRGMVSMQGLGYKEILAYLEGEYPLEEAVRILKTRHQTFCQAAADLVPQRTRCDLGKQRRI